MLDYVEIVEDVNPSRTIAIVGKCHACMGVLRFHKIAKNIDCFKLGRHLHGNSRWFLSEDTVAHLRVDQEKPHGDINGTPLPQRRRQTVGQVVPPVHDKSFTEPAGEPFEEATEGPF